MKTDINLTALLAEIEKLKIEIASLAKENSELRALNNWYMEQFKLSQHERFGASSEKNVMPDQTNLFNEPEVHADIDSDTQEPHSEETITYKRKKRIGKRDELYGSLPTEQKIHELPEDQRACEVCGGALHVCGHEVLRREIVVIPATVRAVEHVQTVYSCRNCENKSDGETTVPMIKAPVPAPLIAGSGIASPSLVASILSNKYVLALPLSRQEQEFARKCQTTPDEMIG